MAGHDALPGRVPGRYYDEHGNEVAVRADVFNRLPAARRPRLYDHRGLRAVRIEVVGHDVGPSPAVADPANGATALRELCNATLGAIRLLLRVMLLLARLV